MNRAHRWAIVEALDACDREKRPYSALDWEALVVAEARGSTAMEAFEELAPWAAGETRARAALVLHLMGKK